MDHPVSVPRRRGWVGLVLCASLSFGMMGGIAHWARPSPSFSTLPRNLQLIGVLSSAEAQTAIAVIQDPQFGKVRFYRLGDRLPHGAILDQISSESVTLRWPDGRTTRLGSALPEG